MQTCQWCHWGVGVGGASFETREELRSDEAFSETLGNTCGVLVILESVFTYAQLLTKHPVIDAAVTVLLLHHHLLFTAISSHRCCLNHDCRSSCK